VLSLGLVRRPDLVAVEGRHRERIEIRRALDATGRHAVVDGLLERALLGGGEDLPRDVVDEGGQVERPGTWIGARPTEVVVEQELVQDGERLAHPAWASSVERRGDLVLHQLSVNGVAALVDDHPDVRERPPEVADVERGVHARHLHGVPAAVAVRRRDADVRPAVDGVEQRAELLHVLGAERRQRFERRRRRLLEREARGGVALERGAQIP
jgi:hypothetical protein